MIYTYVPLCLVVGIFRGIQNHLLDHLLCLFLRHLVVCFCLKRLSIGLKESLVFFLQFIPHCIYILFMHVLATITLSFFHYINPIYLCVKLLINVIIFPVQTDRATFVVCAQILKQLHKHLQVTTQLRLFFWQPTCVETKKRSRVGRNKPVEVMTGSMFPCFERASMHSCLVIWKIRHFSIRCCTYTYNCSSDDDDQLIVNNINNKTQKLN
jgi:hypothetical protein